MKEKYESLKMTVVLLACENVIMTSGEGPAGRSAEIAGEDDSTGTWDE